MYLKKLVSLTAVVAVAVFAGGAQAAAGSTLENLQAAYNGESNANAKYLAFAEKADREGYGQAASLFRAAARAEQVHFERHAEVIKALGAVPKADIKKADVRSTRENLQDALNGETYEYTKMYPEFLAKAEKDKNAGAKDAFEDAKAAEEVHAKLYSKVLADLNAWKGAKKDFYVCPRCGNVVEALAWKLCPICKTSAKKFMTVS